MTGGDARHGRRDNGLIAAQYAAAGDVDPRVGEHLLDVLAIDGIAAYLRPSSDVNPLTRSSTLPNRPTDRLYVDRTHLATARDYLARLATDAADQPPEPMASSDDDLWSRIVAAYDDEPQERSWPAAEDVAEPLEPSRLLEPDARTGNELAAASTDVDDPVDVEPTSGPPAGAGRSTPPAASVDNPGGRGRSVIRGSWPEPGPRASAWKDPEEPSLLDGLDRFGADLDPDPADEEGYTPPAPPPIPRPSLPTALGIVGIIGGLLVFLQPSLIGIDASAAMMLGFTAVVAGFGTLVWRLRPGDEDDEDSDPDDGARV